MSSRNFIPFVQLKLRWNFGGQIKSTTHRWLWPRVWASEFDNPCQCLHLDFVMIFYGIKFSSVSKLVIQWFYTLYHDSCVKITFMDFFFKYFMSFLCQNIRHFNFILLLVQWDCNLWSYITISAWELSILSLTSNQDIIGFPNQSKAFTNSKQNIWIFLIAGNVGSGWQLCMLRNFHWTFSLKWLYLKSELTMLHTCFLMTIYSRCTRCILTEFSFIYGVV